MCGIIGINSVWKYDCGNPKNGWLKKIAWNGVEKKWPCAFDILKNMNFNNEMISELSSFVDYKKLSIPDSADKWLKENAALWKSWIPKKCEK